MSKVDISTVRDLVAERVVVASLLTDCTDDALTAYRDSGCTPHDWTDPSAQLALQVYLQAVALRGQGGFADVLQCEHARKSPEFCDYVLELLNNASSNLPPYLRVCTGTRRAAQGNAGNRAGDAPRCGCRDT